MPFWVLLALLIAGGAGMAFGRKWAWIMTLALSLLYSAFSALILRGLLSSWARYQPPAGDVISVLLPLITFWALTVWTVVRFFGRPWKTRAVGERQ